METGREVSRDKLSFLTGVGRGREKRISLEITLTVIVSANYYHTSEEIRAILESI
jgi:hypothetical protein